MPRRMALNRSFTVPSKLATSSRTAPAAEIGAADGIETLYVHPNASIVKFSTAGPGSRPSSSAGSPRSSLGQQNGGTLPWASPTERTIAAGPLEIYRVPGSVSFLHSGALLHAILPRSQCWCVDGVSKFAFRVLPDTYYRIELPGHTPEDFEKVEEMKVTLSKVLFYEKTACPFARTFSVELPEPHSPKERRSKRKSSHGPAKRWTLDKAYSWKPEDWEEKQRQRSESLLGSGSSEVSEDEAGPGAEVKTPEKESEESSELVDAVRELKVDTPLKPAGLAAMRSVTAPPQLTVRSTPPSRLWSALGVKDGRAEVPEPSTVPSTRLNPSRLRTFQAIPTDMPPSPPDSSAGMELTDAPSRMESLDEEMEAPIADESVGDNVLRSDGAADRDAFDGAIDASTDRRPRLKLHGSRIDDLDPQEAGNRARHIAPKAPKESTQAEKLPSVAPTPRSHAPSPEGKTEAKRPATPMQHATTASPEDPFAAIQARILARRSIGGTTSFHPSRTSPTRESTSSSSSTATIASNATVTSQRSSSTSTHRHQQAFASAMVRKACTVFLGPPAHLVSIMLRIAARFANGAFGVGSGFVIASPAGSKHVPGSFNLESLDADELDGDEEVDWGEDDFGVPLRSPIRLAKRGGGVDVDVDVGVDVRVGAVRGRKKGWEVG